MARARVPTCSPCRRMMMMMMMMMPPLAVFSFCGAFGSKISFWGASLSSFFFLRERGASLSSSVCVSSAVALVISSCDGVGLASNDMGLALMHGTPNANGRSDATGPCHEKTIKGKTRGITKTLAGQLVLRFVLHFVSLCLRERHYCTAVVVYAGGGTGHNAYATRGRLRVCRETRSNWFLPATPTQALLMWLCDRA